MQRPQLKDIEAKSPIPDKLFYKIGEVSKIANVEPYVLRYWESEFPFLRPRKSKSGQRIYVRKDLEVVLEIKDLLYNERFTIEGVRKKFSEGGRATPSGRATPPALPSGNPLPADLVWHIKQRLRELLSRM